MKLIRWTNYKIDSINLNIDSNQSIEILFQMLSVDSKEDSKDSKIFKLALLDWKDF